METDKKVHIVGVYKSFRAKGIRVLDQDFHGPLLSRAMFPLQHLLLIFG
jgi:hypothetical protein